MVMDFVAIDNVRPTLIITPCSHIAAPYP